MLYSNSISRRYLRWLVIGSSTYCLYAFVADLLAALISSLNWNRNYSLYNPVVEQNSITPSMFPESIEIWRGFFVNWSKARSYRPSCLKKSFPLSSTRIKAGKFSTSIFHTASIPSSGKSIHSTFLMFSSASRAAGPPMEPR